MRLIYGGSLTLCLLHSYLPNISVHYFLLTQGRNVGSASEEFYIST